MSNRSLRIVYIADLR